MAVVGAGGIGFDVSEFLVTESSPTLNLKEWKAEWGAADPQEARGALTTPIPLPPAREVYLLQRSKGAQGRRLGKTSGWVHRASLKAKKVQQLSGVNYERIDDDGLHISFGADRSRRRVLDGRQRRDLRRPGAGARPRRRVAAQRDRAAHHRRRGARRRARRQAGDQTGHRTGRPPVTLDADSLRGSSGPGPAGSGRGC